MKRGKESKEKKGKNQKPWWIKTSPGTLIRKLPKQFRIKPKEKIQATVEELGFNLKTKEWFCDTDFKLVEDGTGKYAIAKMKKKVEKETAPVDEEFTVKSVGSGWYNVLSPTGEIVNQKKLRAADADTLKEQLSAKGDE